MAAAAPGWARARPRAAAPLARAAAAGTAGRCWRWSTRSRPTTTSCAAGCAAGGVDPDRDVELVVIPPPQMVERLEAGEIDGFCVGEPWNQVAVRPWQRPPGDDLARHLAGCHGEGAGRHRRLGERAPGDAAALVARPGRGLRLGRPAREPARGGPPPGRASSMSGVPLEAIAYPLLGLVQEAPDVPPRSLPEAHVFHRARREPPRARMRWLRARDGARGQLDRVPTSRGARASSAPTCTGLPSRQAETAGFLCIAQIVGATRCRRRTADSLSRAGGTALASALVQQRPTRGACAKRSRFTVRKADPGRAGRVMRLFCFGAFANGTSRR